MNFADIRGIDVANGPGVRVSLFVSGCTHHCKGCFNPETWDFQYGAPFGTEEIQRILNYLEPSHIRGLSILGGEPFEPENQEAVLELVRQVREKYPQKGNKATDYGNFSTESVGSVPVFLTVEGPGCLDTQMRIGSDLWHIVTDDDKKNT